MKLVWCRSRDTRRRGGTNRVASEPGSRGGTDVSCERRLSKWMQESRVDSSSAAVNDSSWTSHFCALWVASMSRWKWMYSGRR
jgi:hypothetical protein